jgi:hypothetical protein
MEEGRDREIWKKGERERDMEEGRDSEIWKKGDSEKWKRVRKGVWNKDQYRVSD